MVRREKCLRQPAETRLTDGRIEDVVSITLAVYLKGRKNRKKVLNRQGCLANSEDGRSAKLVEPKEGFDEYGGVELWNSLLGLL